MQVLKFGGSSVANAENINRVVEIIKNNTSTTKKIIVVSALGGITDLLLKTANFAQANDELYKSFLQEMESKHLQAVKDLIPVQQQSAVLSLVKKICNEAEDVCNGIFLLRELSERTKDRIVSYGELLSSQIIAAKLNAAGLVTEWKDARELIITDSNYGLAAVDFAATNKKVLSFFAESVLSLYIVPGFIASDKNNVTTTLGRGGSDYTAAIKIGRAHV